MLSPNGRSTRDDRRPRGLDWPAVDTERPEGIESGNARLIGTDTMAIVAAVEELLENKGLFLSMAQRVSPYGDGHAAKRIVDAISEWQIDA